MNKMGGESETVMVMANTHAAAFADHRVLLPAGVSGGAYDRDFPGDASMTMMGNSTVYSNSNNYNYNGTMLSSSPTTTIRDTL